MDGKTMGQRLRAYRDDEYSNADAAAMVEAGLLNAVVSTRTLVSRRLASALIERHIRECEKVRRVLDFGPVCGACEYPRSVCLDCLKGQGSDDLVPFRGTALGEFAREEE